MTEIENGKKMDSTNGYFVVRERTKSMAPEKSKAF